MLHPDTVLRTVSGAVGVGVFASRLIPRGTITWVRDPLDLAVPDAVVQGLQPLQRAVFDRYAWIEDDHWILCWDHGRFVNHACDPTCVGFDTSFEIAVRDIAAGEQLTGDYRTLGLFEDPFDCLCGTSSCAGRVEPGEPDWLVARWRAAFTAAASHLGRVAQPLLPWVCREEVQRLGAVVSRQRAFD